jgi:dolichol-phosphate mannosyltransferase
MFDGRGSLTISLTSRCRRTESWCSKPLPLPGGTASTVGLDRTITHRFESKLSGGGTCFNSQTFRPDPRFPLLPTATITTSPKSSPLIRLAQPGLMAYLSFATIQERDTVRARGAVIVRIRDGLTVPDPSLPSKTEAPRLLISLATYNEADNLKPLVESIRQFSPDCSILVIDDNSPDGTGRVADEIRETSPDVHVLHRPGKLGLGTATLAAVRFAIDHHFDYLLNLDADFSHPPRFIPDLLNGMADHDVMIGSRYVPGGGVEGGFNLKRKLMSSGINGYARLTLGLTSRDNSGAFRCYRVSKLAEIDLDQVRSRGYSFQEEILYWCKSVGCRIGETPILFENRRAGVSKINSREAISALWILFTLGVSRMAGQHQRKR